ncbi:MAG: hypothetical protein VZR09_03250 [Candidatus Gastranaerophilaceae bacterium]|nr:hypothetical protein [Candidatus Gastranaerophilaceae bacterium]
MDTNKETEKYIFPKMMFNIFYSFLVGFFVIYVLSFTGFLFHLSINIFYPIIGIISGLSALIILSDKSHFNVKNTVLSVTVFLTVLILSYKLSGIFYDYSWDGRTYHQGAVILLGNGWNPVYDNIREFIVNALGRAWDIHEEWIVGYPKFVEIVQANIFALTNKLEYSKMFNFILMFMVFGYSIYLLNKYNFTNKFLRFIIAFLIILNPVCIAQMFTFYVDLHVYLYFVLLLLSILDTETDRSTNILALTVIFMSSVCLINIKLSGIFYVVLLLSVYTVYLLIRKNFSVIGYLRFIILGILVFGILSGVNPYITNIKNQRHPLYPLAGTNKTEFMDINTPKVIRNSNYAKRIFISVFSEVDNNVNGEIKIKLPFTIHNRELTSLKFSDTRLSGFGIFWSGILLLTLLMTLFIRFKSTEEKNVSLLIFSLLFISFIANPYNWWARYVPHLWLIPVFVSILTLLKPNKFKKWMVYLILIVIFLNLWIQFVQILKFNVAYKNSLDKTCRMLYNSGKTILIYNPFDFALPEILKEKGINVKFADENYYNSHKSSFYPIMYSIDGKSLWNFDGKYVK